MNKENLDKSNKDETKLWVKILAVSIVSIFAISLIFSVVLGEKFGLKYMLICLGTGMGVILFAAIIGVIIMKISVSMWYIQRTSPVNSVAIVVECKELDEGEEYNYVCLLKIVSSGKLTCGLCNNYYFKGDAVKIFGILYGKKSKLVSIVESPQKEESL